MSFSQSDMLPASMRGLEQAVERFRSVTLDASSSAEAVFIPLSEALAWACSIDDALNSLHGNSYKQARANNPVNAYFVGLRFARNRCTHQLALVAERQHLTLPFRLPATPGLLFRWRPVAELPAADPKHNHGIEAYESHLAGDTADMTLRHATEWLKQAFKLFT